MDDHESLLDALARLCGAFSAVVREPGQRSIYGADPTNCIAYREALAILGRDLEKAHPAARDVVRDFQRAAGDVGPKPRVVVGETVGAKTAEALRKVLASKRSATVPEVCGSPGDECCEGCRQEIGCDFPATAIFHHGPCPERS